MKKYLFLALIVPVMMACGKNERLLTSATGSIYECLVVSDPACKAALCETMEADMYGLPQMEPTFSVSHVTNAQFDDFLKSTRNILLLDVNPNKYTLVKVHKARNVWSKPQAMIRIQAPSDEAALDYWNENGDAIREWFVREELARQIRFYRANTNKDARAWLNQQGYDLLIPEDFMLIKNDQMGNDQLVNVLWCCNNKGPMRKDIVVYSYPYTSQNQFSCDSIVAMRNKVLGQLVSAQVEGSHVP